MTRLAVGFDTETTGLFEPEHRIIEAALLLYDLDTGARLPASFIKRWNPGRSIDPDASRVHGITFEQVAQLPTLEDSPADVDMMIRIFSMAEVVVAHNGISFDEPFMRQELTRIGKTLPRINVADTMLQGTWATPFGKKPNLGELCFACRVPYDPAQAHGATYDVDVMMQCFFFGLQRGFFSTNPSHIAALAAAA